MAYNNPGGYPPSAGPYNPYAAPPTYSVPQPPTAAGANYPPQPQAQYAPYGAQANGPYATPAAGGPYATPVGAYQPYADPTQQWAQPHKPADHSAVHVKPADPTNAPGGEYAEVMNRRVRSAFIRKVYTILAIQLAVTFGIVCLFAFSDTVKTAVQSTPAIFYVALGVSFACLIALSCCPGVAQKFPGNIICLSVFTLAEAYVLGTATSFYDTTSILWALGALVIVVGGLTLFACQTRIDFTLMSGSLFVLLLAFLLFGIWAAIFRSQVVQTIYATIGVLIFGIFLVYDTQLVIGGKHHAVSFTTDDYIFAALNLYIDVVQLFMFLLRLIGNSRD